MLNLNIQYSIIIFRYALVYGHSRRKMKAGCPAGKKMPLSMGIAAGR